MSSEGALQEGTKKRRLRGACDICRRQKIRCDSAKMPGNRCSNCVAFNSECTHNLSQLKDEKGSRRKRTNVQQPTDGTSTNGTTLEKAKNVVDGLLHQTYHAPQDRDALLQLLLEVSRYARGLEQELDAYRQSQSPSDRGSSSAVSPKSEDQNAQDVPEEAGIVLDIQNLPEHLQRITVDTANHRYFGKNSSIMFVKAAMEARTGGTQLSVPRSTRRVYWTTQPWEVHPEPFVPQIFPPADLLRDLVDIYFTEINIFSFILHRPTFEKSIADGLHLCNQEFGAVVLAVCALASKNSSDKRVFLPGTEGELSAGYEWFRQIRRPFSGPVVKATSLYELQLCCLYISFRHTGSDLESIWLLAGIGILHALDIGAHRLLEKNSPLTIENELTKRSCYYLSVFDSIVSACFGRPRVSDAAACDLSRPLVCDDEYWEHPDPKMAFRQPPGKPALCEYNIAYINLIKIFTFSWRKSGSPQDYTGTEPLEPETVAELDARLNTWANEIPEHLLWNPYQKDDVFFEQSAALYSSYYHVQILAHRPFIQASNASTLKSLAICTNAARSCSTVADVKSRRGFMPSHHFVKAVFDSAIVLLLNISGGTRSGLSIDTERELVDVYKCMAFLRQTDARWQNAGRFYDILCELLNASNFPLPPTSSLGSNQSFTTYYDRKNASSKANVLDRQSPNDFDSLPMAAEDLGRLPIYGSLDSFDMDVLERSFTAPNGNAASPLDYLSLGVSGVGSYAYEPPTFKDDMDIDTYLYHWMPYFTTVDGMAQVMQTGPAGI